MAVLGREIEMCAIRYSGEAGGVGNMGPELMRKWCVGLGGKGMQVQLCVVQFSLFGPLACLS